MFSALRSSLWGVELPDEGMSCKYKHSLPKGLKFEREVQWNVIMDKYNLKTKKKETVAICYMICDFSFL